MGSLSNRLPAAVAVWLINEVPACRVLPWRGSKERALGFSYAYAQTWISLMSLLGISERLARTVRRTRGTPAALMASSKSPLRLPADGSNRPEKLNGSSFAGSSNSHSFDQPEPQCLIETDISIPVLSRFSSTRQT